MRKRIPARGKWLSPTGPGAAAARHLLSHGDARRGFSLLEVVVVMAIIAVLSAVAVPRYAASVARYRADAAAQRIIADLAYARHRAVSTSASVTVGFDPVSDSYAMAGVTDPDRPHRDYAVDLREDPYCADLVSADLGGDGVLIFDGYGAPDSAGTIVVSVGTATRTVLVDAESGEAAIP